MQIQEKKRGKLVKSSKKKSLGGFCVTSVGLNIERGTSGGGGTTWNVELLASSTGSTGITCLGRNLPAWTWLFSAPSTPCELFCIHHLELYSVESRGRPFWK